jgi:hypothetical protein
MFTQNVGVGAMARFSRAETGLTSPASGESLALRFGGLQFGSGLRLRFGRIAARKEPPRPRPPAPSTSEPSSQADTVEPTPSDPACARRQC